MSAGPVSDALARRLHKQACAERWQLPVESFQLALQSSADHAFRDRQATPRDIDQYLTSLKLEDLAIACACAKGIDAAWEHFVREVRPHMLRAADALDKTGGARELADSLYGDLFGVRDGGGDGAQRSLFRYFHGRSSLTTWLRAVLAQRYVDRLRAARSLEPLPEADSAAALAAPAPTADPSHSRYGALMREGLGRAVAALSARDRLRLSLYYAQDMTLAAIGRMTAEHEATVSRHLTRTRRDIRNAVERDLRERLGLSAAEIVECFASNVSDPGELDLNAILDSGRKELASGRSI